MSAWYKTESTRIGRAGIVDNGDCVDPSSFSLHTGNDDSGRQVVAAIDTYDSPNRVKTGARVVGGYADATQS